MIRLAALLLAGTIASALIADEPSGNDVHEESKEKPTSFWMERKMEYSQGVLRGLATGDFERISQAAAQLGLLNRVEGFVRRKNLDYQTHLHTFQRVIDELFRQANNENLEGVTLAFNQLTVSCVKCHQSLRGEATGGESPKTTLPLKKNTAQ